MAIEPGIERLRVFLQTIDLNPEERGQIEALLAQATQDDKVALTRVEQLASERGYQPIPGKDYPLPPGPLMICPVDPAHYRTFQREVGETCPEHGVTLVPAEAKE